MRANFAGQQTVVGGEQDDREARPECFEVESGSLSRVIIRRDGSRSTTSFGPATDGHSDLHAEVDRRLLASVARPRVESDSSVSIVDLFSGCGGLSLGALEGARALGLAGELRLAVDHDPAPLAVLSRALDAAHAVRPADLARALDGNLGSRATHAEKLFLHDVSRADVALAGPPCQGHSALNNHTRHDDHRNDLYLRAIRFVELNRPRLTVIENVPAILRDQRRSVERAIEHLKRLQYRVDHQVVALDELGVPQTRRRHVLVATALGERALDVDDLVASYRVADSAARTVKWAIGDLDGSASGSEVDRPSAPSPENLRRMRLLIEEDLFDLPNPERPPCHRDKDHSYKSMYGRLDWEKPAQTITSGFGSMGQGRYVHPREPRTLTPREAARLQLLPDFYDFSVVSGRGRWAQMIGNVAPMKLSYCAVVEFLR